MTGIELAGDPNAHAEEAWVLIDLKRYKEALAACSRAIASDPEEASHYATLVRIHLLLKQYKEALDAARRVVSLAPEWPYGYYLASICLHHCLDFDGELRAAEHALALNPEDPDLLDRVARAQIQSGLLNKARTTATQLCRVSPETSGTFSLLSDICFELNDYENAEAYLLSALKIDPEDAVLHNDLGRIRLARKSWQLAIEAFYTAAKIQPVIKVYQDNLNIAISDWLDNQAIRGKRSQALEALAPEVRAFYRHKLDCRSAFERLGMFGPILSMVILLAMLTFIFDRLF